MYKSSTQLRVRYAETDRMGYVYYGHYASYFEVGRVETLRELGFPYRLMEDSGILLPVTDYNVKYLAPARYDDRLSVTTVIPELPTARIVFDYEIRSAEDERLLSTASTRLVFVRAESGRPIRCPQELTNALLPYFVNH